MPSDDPVKARERKRRYLERKKIEKYGPEAAGKNMTGRHGNHAKGPANARWNDGLSRHTDGYIKVRVGQGHPCADPNGYAYLHLLVWLAAGNDSPGPDDLIHHRNEVKTDNRIDNLELKTRSDHARHHDAVRGRDAAGRFPVGPNDTDKQAAEWPADLRVREFPTVARPDLT
jgi:hypothetical protein